MKRAVYAIVTAFAAAIGFFLGRLLGTPFVGLGIGAVAGFVCVWVLDAISEEWSNTGGMP